MTPEQLKILRAALVAGTGAAAIGAIARANKSRKDRKKALDIASSKNAIVVPVSIPNFMKDLPTPGDLAKSRGEGSGVTSAEESRPEMGNVDLALAAKGLSDMSDRVEFATPGTIEARKREILKGRKFNFFGGNKSASAEVRSESDPGKKDEAVSEEKIDGRTVLRGSDGKFVSPNDPVAVEYAEKDASWNFAKDWLRDIWASATGKPLALAAGAVGSIVLAEKISGLINERRKERAKNRAERSRERYVDLLEGADGASEKTAGSEPSQDNWVGKAVGASFFIPLALTALVTNKILENRKAEKKRQKSMGNSFPEDAYVLYKTQGGDNLKIAADTALMAIMVKRAMIEDAERAEAEFIKIAQSGSPLGWNAAELSNSIRPGEDEVNKQVEYAVKHMTDPKNRGKLLKFIQAQKGGNEDEKESAYRAMMPTGTWFGNHYDVARTPEFRRALATNKTLQDAVVNNLETDADWKAYRDQNISDRIAGWGLDRGGVLHKIIMWLAQTLGFGNAMAKNYVTSGFDKARDSAQAEIDERAAMAERAKQERLAAEHKKHFAPLENFKGTKQEREKLENDLTDSWMVRQVDGISSPEEFQAMAGNLAQINPMSPQYKMLYDALGKKQNIDPETFGNLVSPQQVTQNSPAPAQSTAPSTAPAPAPAPAPTPAPEPAPAPAPATQPSSNATKTQMPRIVSRMPTPVLSQANNSQTKEVKTDFSGGLMNAFNPLAGAIFKNK